jgi:hypothetical protein
MIPTQTKEQKALRKRFYEDFGFYSKHALKVRTKKGTVAPFKLNTVQTRFDKEVDDQRRRTGRVRKIILKGRQQGLSTYVSGRMYSRLSQRKRQEGPRGRPQGGQHPRTLFDMYQRYSHDLLPPMLKPETIGTPHARSWCSTKLDTGAHGRDRRRRRHRALVKPSPTRTCPSMAFWPASTRLQENLTRPTPVLSRTLPTPRAYVESTANGYNDVHRNVR